MAAKLPSFKDLSMQQKIILLIVTLTVVNLTIIAVFSFFYYSYCRGYVNNIVRGALKRAGSDFGELNSWDKKGNEETVTSATNVLKINPKNIEALQQRAQALNFLREHQKSLDDYNSLVALEPKNVRWHKGRAEQMRWLNRYRDAVAEASTVIAMEKNSDNVLKRAGDYIQLNDRASALKDLEASVPLPPLNPPPAIDNSDKTRADLYKELKMKDKFLFFINKYISSNQKSDEYSSLEALHDRAEFYVDEEDYAPALADYKKLTGDRNDYASDSDRKGEAGILLLMGKKAEAKQVLSGLFNAAVKTFDNKDRNYDDISNCAQALNLYRVLHPNERDWAKDQTYKKLVATCVSRCKKILDDKNDSDNKADGSNVSNACDLVEDVPPELSRDLTALLIDRLKPAKGEGTHQQLIKLYYHTGDLKALQDAFPEGSKERDSHFYHKCADCESKLGHNKEAMELAKKSLQLAPDEDCGQITMVRVALAAGDAKQAQKYYDLYLKSEDGEGDDYLQSKIYEADGNKVEAARLLRRAAAKGSEPAIKLLLARP
ncbi:MAG: hypothetical protein JSS83_03345 [Cyanobacteria bacterium SZAS LIN-3]|nr:hypothetical protein [Cyanobacteria bacterium SZAS LIN-3]